MIKPEDSDGKRKGEEKPVMFLGLLPDEQHRTACVYCKKNFSLMCSTSCLLLSTNF